MNKFENVDVIASLQAVMKQNTTHYQSDFQYDADLFRAAAKSADSMEKTFLWLSRPDGTYCERERDALGARRSPHDGRHQDQREDPGPRRSGQGHSRTLCRR